MKLIGIPPHWIKYLQLEAANGSAMKQVINAGAGQWPSIHQKGDGAYTRYYFGIFPNTHQSHALHINVIHQSCYLSFSKGKGSKTSFKATLVRNYDRLSD